MGTNCIPPVAGLFLFFLKTSFTISLSEYYHVDVIDVFKNVLKRVSFGSKDYTKELKLEYAYILGQTS